MRYEFHPEALDEYNEAGHYYARRQPGLDLRFIVSVEEAIERILDDPYRWRPFDEDCPALPYPSFSVCGALHD